MSSSFFSLFIEGTPDGHCGIFTTADVANNDLVEKLLVLTPFPGMQSNLAHLQSDPFNTFDGKQSLQVRSGQRVLKPLYKA